MSSNQRTKTGHGCSASHSSSAEIIGSNQDLLVQIMVQLPSKSLLKFKCVSKEWQSIISSPRFARCRKPHRNSPCGLLVQKFSTDEIIYELVSLDSSHSDAPLESLNFIDDPQLNIVGSSNGLLLCESFMRYYVYNPTTKQHTQLPPLRSHAGIEGLYLAFDPLKSPYYKVICVYKLGYVKLHKSLHRCCEFDVYSSEQRCWKTCATAACPTSDSIDFKRGVFCNGSIHWLCFGIHCTLMYFNIDKDQACVLYSQRQWQQLIQYFGASRDHLHVVDCSLSSDLCPKIFNVYEMSKNYSGWMVKYRVNLGALLNVFPEMVTDDARNEDDVRNMRVPIPYKYRILCISRGETDEDSFLVLQTPQKIIRYDLKDEASFKKLCDFDDAADEERLRIPLYLFWPYGNYVYQYYESLASV